MWCAWLALSLCLHSPSWLARFRSFSLSSLLFSLAHSHIAGCVHDGVAGCVVCGWLFFNGRWRAAHSRMVGPLSISISTVNGFLLRLHSFGRFLFHFHSAMASDKRKIHLNGNLHWQLVFVWFSYACLRGYVCSNLRANDLITTITTIQWHMANILDSASGYPSSCFSSRTAHHLTHSHTFTHAPFCILHAAMTRTIALLHALNCSLLFDRFRALIID